MNFRLLFGLLWQPLIAVKKLRDRAPVAFSVGIAWLMTLLYVLIAAPLIELAQEALTPTVRSAGVVNGAGGVIGGITRTWLSNSIEAVLFASMLVLFVAVIYVPFAILIANLFERRESFSIAIREEYASTVSCTLISMAVSFLVTIFPAIVISWQAAWMTSDAVIGYVVLLWVIPLPIFAALMTLTIGTIFRIGWVAAVGTTLISFLSLLGVPLLVQAANFVCSFPLLLVLLLFLLRDRIDDFMKLARARHSFKQNLEAATLNPADASAHYNLGLLYQNRGEFESAIEAFRRAVEIDPREIDAHYQLGRIAREQGRLTDAIAHFEKVVEQNPSHSHHEIWRETALVYYAAGQYLDALEMQDRFLAERPSDAQGHYWRGLTLYELGRAEEAVQEMRGCIESVKTAPAYKYRTERQWLHLAQSFLRERQ